MGLTQPTTQRRPAHRRLRALVGIAAAVLLFAAGVLAGRWSAFPATPATLPSTTDATVANTAGLGVSTYAGPNRKSGKVAALSEGATIRVVCQDGAGERLTDVVDGASHLARLEPARRRDLGPGPLHEPVEGLRARPGAHRFDELLSASRRVGQGERSRLILKDSRMSVRSTGRVTGYRTDTERLARERRFPVCGLSAHHLKEFAMSNKIIAWAASALAVTAVLAGPTQAATPIRGARPGTAPDRGTHQRHGCRLAELAGRLRHRLRRPRRSGGARVVLGARSGRGIERQHHLVEGAGGPGPVVRLRSLALHSGSVHLGRRHVVTDRGALHRLSGARWCRYNPMAWAVFGIR